MTGRCSWAGCDRTDTTPADGWDHCSEHLREHRLLMAEEAGRERQRNGKPAAVCGSVGGYRKHLRLKEPTCAACRAANSADVERRRAAA